MQFEMIFPNGILSLRRGTVGIRTVYHVRMIYISLPWPLIITRLIFQTSPAIEYRPKFVLDTTDHISMSPYRRGQNILIVMNVPLVSPNSLVMLPTIESNNHLLKTIASYINSQWFIVVAYDLWVRVWYVNDIQVEASVYQKILGKWLLTGTYTGPALMLLLLLFGIPFVCVPAINGASAVMDAPAFPDVHDISYTLALPCQAPDENEDSSVPEQDPGKED